MRKWIPLWTIPVLLVFAFSTVWLRLTVVKSTYEYDQASKILRNLKLENEKLELRVAQLRSPRHLELISKQKFRLKPPSADQIIRIKE